MSGSYLLEIEGRVIGNYKTKRDALSAMFCKVLKDAASSPALFLTYFGQFFGEDCFDEKNRFKIDDLVPKIVNFIVSFELDKFDTFYFRGDYDEYSDTTIGRAHIFKIEQPTEFQAEKLEETIKENILMLADDAEMHFDAGGVREKFVESVLEEWNLD